MFNIRQMSEGTRNSTGTSKAIQTKYDSASLLSGGALTTLNQSFGDFANINDDDMSEAGQLKLARQVGAINGANVALTNTVKLKSQGLQGVNRMASTVMQWGNTVARAQSQYEQTMSRGLQGMSQSLHQINMTREQHAGFNEYIKADKLIKY